MSTIFKGTIAAASVATVFVLAWMFLDKPHVPPPVVCTMEAKQCPDGTFVGRQGPDCSFAPCGRAGWAATTTQGGITFKYPLSIPTQYIHPVDWPPSVQVLDQPYTCTVAGETPVLPAGMTREVRIGTTSYCVTQEDQGAAGSIYSLYAYAFAYDNKTLILTFSMQRPQCVNYDEPKQSACKTEQNSYDIGSLTDAIAKTVVVNNSVAQPTATIRGTVTMGPTCPVVRKDTPCPDVPYANATLQLKTFSGYRPIATIHTNEKGQYSVSVAPGTYVVQSSPENRLPRCSSEPITPRSKEIAVLDVSCDTGIR